MGIGACTVRNPFIGLRPFQSVESALFFGRTRDIAILRDLILAVPCTRRVRS
jgi:hypothetical protein